MQIIFCIIFYWIGFCMARNSIKVESLPSGDTPRSWFTGVEDWLYWAELKQECLARLGHQGTVGKELSTYRRRNHSVKGVE